MTRIAVQTLARAGAVDLLNGYRDDADLRLQVYRARPRSIKPPTAFVDGIDETLTDYTITTRQRSPAVSVVVIHGLFDSGEAADQRDTFVDGFLDWVADRYHGFGANTLVQVSRVTDLPSYVPDWLPPNEQSTYYATQIVLEGFAST